MVFVFILLLWAIPLCVNLLIIRHLSRNCLSPDCAEVYFYISLLPVANALLAVLFVVLLVGIFILDSRPVRKLRHFITGR